MGYCAEEKSRQFRPGPSASIVRCFRSGKTAQSTEGQVRSANLEVASLWRQLAQHRAEAIRFFGGETKDMLSRRDLLKNLTGGAVAIPLIGSAVATQLRDSAQNPTSDCSRPLNGPHAHYFPNVVVYTHEGRRALFYDDL